MLLTGMEELCPMDEEVVGDYVNIHFQRTKNGGGEVDMIKCSLNEPCIAYFQE